MLSYISYTIEYITQISQFYHQDLEISKKICKATNLFGLEK